MRADQMSSVGATKKLTYIVNYLSADDAQHYVHIPRLMHELQRLGWEVDIVSERGGTGRAEILGQPVKFLSRRSKFVRLVNLTRHLLTMRSRGGRLVFVRISKLAAFASALLGKVFGWKTIFWLSGTVEDFNRRAGLRGRLSFGLVWALFRVVDFLATGPETMVRYYQGLYGLPARKILLLYNDVDTVTPRRPTAPNMDDIVHVLLVHRLSPVRDTARYFPNLLEALGEFARETKRIVQLDVCGDGPERARLEQIGAGAADVQVHFHGGVPQRQLGAFYGKATLFVMPSYREGFPRVMIEAMAEGLPMVATSAGGSVDLCGPLQQQYVIDREDAAAFGQAVKRLLAAPRDRAALATENLRWVTRFSSPEVARMYDRTLSGIITARPAP
jgi:glycosyltransferase involved in cell wall biosynthesis